MLLTNIKTIFHQELDGLYPKEEIDAFFYHMVEHYLNVERFVLALQPHLTLSKAEEQPLFEGLAQLKRERPLQYILGEAHFMDLTLKVNEHVLIPRPETEELVRWVINEFRIASSELGVVNDKKESSERITQNPKLKILDIGTGSGCIAIALAKALPNAMIFAMDISEKALDVAIKNSEINDANISFILADILNLELEHEHEHELELEFDLIVSNPPYVRESEKAEMRNNVKKYEPEAALFVPNDDPLRFYKAIGEFAARHLKSKGSIFLEINQYMAKETHDILVDNQFHNVELRKDIFGNFRMLKGSAGE